MSVLNRRGDILQFVTIQWIKHFVHCIYSVYSLYIGNMGQVGDGDAMFKLLAYKSASLENNIPVSIMEKRLLKI